MKSLTDITASLAVVLGSGLIFSYFTATKSPIESVNAQNQQIPQTDQTLAQSSPLAQTDQTIAQSSRPLTNTPKRLKINIKITNPEDLKVKEGDMVKAGQIIADKDRERTRITAQRDKLILAIQQIESYNLLPPPKPKTVPPITSLPTANFAESEAAIESARLQLNLARRNYEAEMREEPFIEEIASVDMARARTEQFEREVQLQQRRVDAIALISTLPPEVIVHETESLKRKMRQWEQVQADYNFKTAELENAKQGREERLKNLAAKIEQTQANLALAQSRLEKAKADRAHLEYQHSITKARRIEEENQARQSYARQQQEFVQQQRDRDFKLAQLSEQLAQVEERLANLSVVRSPYAGLIKRIKTQKQQDNTLSVEISLIPNSGDNFANPTNNGTNPNISIPSGTGIQ